MQTSVNNFVTVGNFQIILKIKLMKKEYYLIIALIVFTIGCTNRVLKYNRSGHLKFLLQNYTEAIVDYTKVIAIDPKNTEAYFGRGLSNARLKNYTEAIVDYSKVIEINIKDSQASYYRGYAKYELQDYRGAIVDFTQTIESDPKNGDAYSIRGTANEYLQNFEGAIFDFTKAIEIKPKFAWDIDKHINSSIDRWIIDDSISRFIAKNPNNAIAYILRGKYTFSVDDFSKAIKIDSNNAVAYTLRGRCKNHVGDKAGDAIDDYNKAITIEPNCLEVYNRYSAEVLGLTHPDMLEVEDIKKILLWNSRYHDRSYDLDKYLKLKKEEKELFSNIVFNDSTGIVTDYSKVVKKNPNFDFSYYQNGAEKIRMQYFSELIFTYDEAITNNPNDGETYFLRGNLKTYLQDHGGAIADYTKAIQLDPKNVEAYYNRTCGKFNLQDYNGAVADFTKLIEINPQNADAYYKRGLLEIKIVHKDSGCKDLSKAGELGYSKAYEAIKEFCQ